MSGGFGGSGQGKGPWGGAEPEPPPGQFESPLYPVPIGQKFGSVPPERFSGEPASGPLSRAAGLLFFSPALLSPASGNEIDVDSIGVVVTAADSYPPPVQENNRVFFFSRTGTSRTNNFLYRSQPKAYTAVGTMVQTIPPGPTTVVRVM